MRIGFVSQWFPPEPGMVVATSIVDGLAARGHEIHVLTGFPNYPSGKLHDGYPLRPYRRDQRGPSITVHRAPLFPDHSTSIGKRSLNYLSFAAAASHVARKHLPDMDAWLVYSSPATAAIPAFAAARRTNTPVYLLIQDLWPDSVFEADFAEGSAVIRAARSVLDRYCRWTYRHARRIGVISEGMADVLVARGADPSSIIFTPNSIDESALHADPLCVPAVRESLGISAAKRLFVYAGNLGDLQYLEPVVTAFRRCPDAELVLVGDGVRRETLEELARGATNVKFVPPQPTTGIRRYLDAADVHVISLRDTPMLRATMPSKTQVAMYCGRPILAHASGDIAALVDRTGMGVAVQPGEHDELVAAIRLLISGPVDLLAKMGDRSRTTYFQTYSRQASIDCLEQLLHEGASP